MFDVCAVGPNSYTCRLATCRAVCRCEDHGEITPQINGIRYRNKIAWGNVSIEWFKWDELPGLVASGGQGLSPASHYPPRDLSRYGAFPDLVVFNMGNWDAAFSQFRHFQTSLASFIRAFEDAYLSRERRPVFVFRSAQYFCCSKSQGGRRFTTERLRAFTRYALRELRSRWDLIVWDVYSIAESRAKSDEVVGDCHSSHSPASLVALENQVLANALCN
jgi:hypothetical protein